MAAGVFVPYLEWTIERIALNAKVVGGPMETRTRWWLQPQEAASSFGASRMAGVGMRLLVATSHTGKVGVWNAVTQHWQVQDVVPITSCDTAGSFLLLGCNNGSIYYIDMQKFPLRMKDNDLLVTELYHDASNDAITALSVYLTPKTSVSGNWIEIAYGTSSGAVRVIVQHPETVGSGPQLFQTFTVHRSPVTKIMLSEKHLVSVCADNNHVRTWTVTRFRGMISTQPGSTPLASFKYSLWRRLRATAATKVIPITNKLFVRLSSTGKRICEIQSVDGTTITCFMVRECEGSSRMGSRPRHVGGPTEEELLQLLDQCDLSTSRCATPTSALLQLQAQEPIPENQATYGAVRPYRESPLLARARRTEPFNSYRDFQDFSLSRGVLDSTAQSCPTEGRRSVCEFGAEDSERRPSHAELWASRGSSSVKNSQETPRQPPDSPVVGGDVRRKVFPQSTEEEVAGSGGDVTKTESGTKKRGVLDGGFLGRKKAHQSLSCHLSHQLQRQVEVTHLQQHPLLLLNSAHPRHHVTEN
ncbi:hypothetical protein WMY93_013552 [Mugilogobius chulae]|uniref:Uncharacterized protein n=1 Tax=Mugilogobius chulae TaxID=88201 RepID=A0AAW0P0A6_9GOBI